MKKTGEILKNAREEKGLSLHEIGLSLKINSKVLKAIEEGDELHLPAKTFLRGFVQSYANFLRLDPEKVLEIFHEEMGSTKPKPLIRPVEDSVAENESADQQTTSEKPQGSSSSSSFSSDNNNLKALHEKKNTKNIVISILVIVLFSLIIFTKKMIDKYTKEAQTPSEAVAQTIQGATPLMPDSQTVGTNVSSDISANPMANMTNTTSPSAETQASVPTQESKEKITTSTPTPDSTAVSTKAIAAPSVAVTAQQPTTAIPSVAPTATANAAKPAPAVDLKAKPEATAAAASPLVNAPAPSPATDFSKPVELIVEALDAVEIEYSAPNGKPQKIKLSAEQVHTFKSKSGLKINFSNGGAVNLIHNGKDLGIPGDLGKPIKLSY